MKEIINLQQQLINNLTKQLLMPEPTTHKAQRDYVLLCEKERVLRDEISKLSESKSEKKQCMYCEKEVDYSTGIFTCAECSGNESNDHSVDVNETISDEEIEEQFLNEFGHQPTSSNKYRLQGAKWMRDLKLT